MSELPEGWVNANIGDAADRVVVGYVGPSRQHYDPNGIPFLMGKNVRAGHLLLDNLERVSPEFHEREVKSQLFPNDVVVVRIGRSGTAVVIPDSLGPANCAGLVIVKNPTAVLPNYMAYYLNSPKGQQASLEEVRGVTRQTLNTKSVEAARIPIAPLSEQRRIIAKLQKLLGKVETCQQRLEKIPRILKRFRQAVLAAACSGKLTAGWRSVNPNNQTVEVRLAGIKRARLKLINKDSEAAKLINAFNEAGVGTDEDALEQWLLLKAECICDFITKGTTPNTKEVTSEGEIPFLKVQHIINNKLDFWSLPCFVPKETHNGLLRRSKVYPRDVLMNIVGPPLNKVAIVPNDFPEWNINQALAIFRPVEGIKPEYLRIILSHEGTLEHILRESRGIVGQSNISLEQCRDLMILVPPLSEQQEIVRRVESLFKVADQLEERYLKAKAHVDKLTQSILAKAFRGELVPIEAELARQEGRDYESATVLLERIKSERETRSPAVRGERKSRKHRETATKGMFA